MADSQPSKRLIGGNWVLPLIIGHLVLVVGCGTTSWLMKQASMIPNWEASYDENKGSEFAGAYEDLKARLQFAGITVAEIPGLTDENDDKVAGLTWRGRRQIALEANFAPNAKFEVLSHEAGHLFHSPTLTWAERECYAEIVGVRIQEYYGYTAGKKNSPKYLAAYKTGFPGLKYLGPEMDLAVKAATGQIYWTMRPQDEP